MWDRAEDPCKSWQRRQQRFLCTQLKVSSFLLWQLVRDMKKKAASQKAIGMVQLPLVKLRNGSGFTQQSCSRSSRCRGRCETRVLARAWVGDQRTESFYRCPKSRAWFGRPHEASAPLIVLS